MLCKQGVTTRTDGWRVIPSTVPLHGIADMQQTRREKRLIVHEDDQESSEEQHEAKYPMARQQRLVAPVLH
jgi:hypothetical protein